MSNQQEFQEYIEDTELLRKRAWDLTDQLDKLERQLNTTVDADERNSLQTRINKTSRLLERRTFTK